MKSTRQRAAQMIADKTLSGSTDKRFSKEIAAFLIEQRLVGEFDSLLRDIRVDWAAEGYIDVVAYSAYPLSDVVKADITKQVRNYYPAAKQIHITEEIDPSIIAGVRVELADSQLDLSVQGSLNKFKQLTSGE